jgi:hypothetical protein
MHVVVPHTFVICKDWQLSKYVNQYTNFIYLFLVYLMMLSIAQIIQHRMIVWLLNNELERTSWTYIEKIYLDI